MSISQDGTQEQSSNPSNSRSRAREGGSSASSQYRPALRRAQTRQQNTRGDIPGEAPNPPRYAVQPSGIRFTTQTSQVATNTLPSTTHARDWAQNSTGRQEESGWVGSNTSQGSSRPRRYSEVYPEGPEGVDPDDRAIPISSPSSHHGDESPENPSWTPGARHHRRSSQNSGSQASNPGVGVLSRGLAGMTVQEIARVGRGGAERGSGVNITPVASTASEVATSGDVEGSGGNDGHGLASRVRNQSEDSSGTGSSRGRRRMPRLTNGHPRVL